MRNDLHVFFVLGELIHDTRVSNQFDEYAKLPHYFFAFPSSHLDAVRKEYFEKTAKGIEWVING